VSLPVVLSRLSVASTKRAAALVRGAGWWPAQGRGWVHAQRDGGREADKDRREGH